jgi:hypothetical protein
VKAVGRTQRDADVLYRTWRYFVYRDARDEPLFATPRQITSAVAVRTSQSARWLAR